MNIAMGRRLTLVAALAMAGLGPLADAARADSAIVTVAGTGVPGFAGDGGPATAAQLNIPYAVAAGPAGDFLIADAENHRVRRVLADGRIVTAAGTGVAGDSGDGGPATSARLTFPRGLAVLPDGGYLIADRNAHVIRRVLPDGTITTVAGTGVAGFSGDGGRATAAQLNLPYAATPLPAGGFLIADRGNHAIRRVDAAGRISTVAGTPPAGGFSGDGGPATAASVNAPCGVALAPDGSFLFPDRDNNRVRRVAPDGTISTIAGNGTSGDSGDGGPATAASVTGPYAVLVRPDGAILIGERGGNRVRSISPTGTIATIAGTGAGGFNGDGPAIAAQLNDPVGLAQLPNGDVLVADASNHRVRLLTMSTLPVAGPPLAAPPNPTPGPRAGAVAFRIALRSARATRRALRLRFTLSAPARVRVEVRRRGRRVLRRKIPGHRGRNAVTLRVRLAPGRYTVRLVAHGHSLRRTVRTR
jgi:NHL repeat